MRENRVRRHRHWLVVFCLAAMLLSEARSPATGLTLPGLTELSPVNAFDALIASFDKFPIVALCEGQHTGKKENEFIRSLISDPRFASKVNDVVVEVGNALYQNVMDKYVVGEEVSQSELRQVWRNTTQAQTLITESPVYEQLFTTVRAVNQKLPKAKRLRVLLGDPPIDWYKPDVSPMAFLADRNPHYAGIIEKEVLAKGRKALLIAGGMHFLRGKSMPGENIVGLIEKSHPGKVFVVEFHEGFGDRTAELESRLSAWTVPSFTPIKGTWLGEVDATLRFPKGTIMRRGANGEFEPASPFDGRKMQDLMDGYIYLGPVASLSLVPPPPEVEKDETYMRELERRRKLIQEDRQRQARPVIKKH